MKQKILLMILSIILVASLLVTFSTTASAKTAYSNAAPSLKVNVINPDGTVTLVYEYTGTYAGFYTVDGVSYNIYSYPELEALANYYYYSSIDAMPAAVGTKAWGVTIAALVADANQRNAEGDPDIVWGPGQSIRMYPTDASSQPYQGNNFYSYEFVQGQTRYYYPNLVEKYTTYRANGGADTTDLQGWDEGVVPVEPVFCLSSFQERYTTDAMLKAAEPGEYIFKPNDDEADWRTITTPVTLDSKESFRFCMGLTPTEASNGVAGTYSSTNKFCRWVFQIDIGPMKGPTLIDDRDNNIPGQAIDITFTDFAAWRSSINNITVDDETIDPAHYTVSAGIISFDSTVFTTAGSHSVVVMAPGYLNTQMTQNITTANSGGFGGFGGGGFGGSSPSLETISLSGFVSGDSLQIDSEGLIQSTSQIKTTDEKITFDISSGTRLLTAENTALSSLTAEAIDTPPDPPAGADLVLTFELGPAGATFDPPLDLTVKYGELPAGADESTIRLVYWNGDSWENVAGELDTVNGVVKAKLSHFSEYAVAVDLLAPASFNLSDLTLTPATVNPGETVSVQVMLSNQGEMTGSYEISFKVDDTEVDSREVQLEPGNEQLLTFQFQSDEPGEHIVAVNDKQGRFVVEALPVPTSSTPATNIIPDETVTPQGSVASLPDESTQPAIDWILIGAIAVGGIFVITALSIIIIRRKKL